MMTHLKSRVTNPNPKYALAALVDSDLIEPTSFTQVNQHPASQAAMCVEFDPLQRNDTWSLVLPKPTINILSNKWVFKIKKKADGSVESFKA